MLHVGENKDLPNMLFCIHFQGICYLMHRVETIPAQKCKTLLRETGFVSYLSEKPKVVEEKNVARHRLFSAFFPGKFLSRINYVSFQFEYLGIKDVSCLGGDNSWSQKYLLTRWTNYPHHPLLQLLCARFPWVPKAPLDKFTRVSAMLKNTLKK